MNDIENDLNIIEKAINNYSAIIVLTNNNYKPLIAEYKQAMKEIKEFIYNNQDLFKK